VTTHYIILAGFGKLGLGLRKLEHAINVIQSGGTLDITYTIHLVYQAAKLLGLAGFIEALVFWPLS
jgi:hypothetical protein